MKLPPYVKFPDISDDNITLRQIQFPELKDLLEISYYDGVQATTWMQAMEMQAKINADYMEGNSIHWGIEDKSTNKIVGTCGYYRGFDNGAGELGCVLLPQYRGHGYMTFALSLAIEFGRNTIGLKRIWAMTTKENQKAIDLLERLNFIKMSDFEDQEIEFELSQEVNVKV
jgi:ribosomal-protein-alanine N-acetyltransferase